MSAQHRALIGAVAASASLFALAGCGTGKDTNAPTATAGTSGAQVEIGNTINYGSFGTTAEIDCVDGKSLTVGGSNNTLTIRGTCSTVNIGGTDNRVTFDKVVDSLNVIGLNNFVSYANGDPKVNDTGSGNSIRKG